MVLGAALLLMSFANANLIRIPRNGQDLVATVAILLPVRNEAKNIQALVKTLKAQVGISNLKFYFLDDNSEDETLQLLHLEIAGDKRFHVIEGSELPVDWLGKPWALEQLRTQIKSEYLVCIDADVRLEPRAICAALNLLIEQNLDFLSPYPKQIANSFSERLIQPLLQWSWLATVPLRIAEKSSNPAFAVANGQFFIVRSEKMRVIGGYAAIKAEVLDDLQLARVLLRNGSKGTVISGAHIATCHMYESWQEVKSGYGKSLWAAFGSKIGAIFTIALLFFTGIFPIIALMAGSSNALYALEFVILSRLISARVSNGRIIDSLLHPLSSALLIYLIFYSWLARGKVQWKGRTV
jgi:glycosyltransferase involved in cell wall biosynthesis